MRKSGAVLLRMVILAASAGIAVLMALMPSVFVQYALPFSDQWYSHLSPESQDSIVRLLRVLIPVLAVFAIATGIVQIVIGVKRKKSKPDNANS